MSRPSWRELEREIETLGPDGEARPGLFVTLPDGALREDHPEYEIDPDEIRVTDETDEPEVCTPFHAPAGFFGDTTGVALLTPSRAVRWWSLLPEDALEAEREYREQHGYPIPPLLEEANT